MLTRPSILVVEPSVSPWAAAGKIRVARKVDSFGNVSTVMMCVKERNARCTNFSSGKSARGSAPKSSNVRIFPATAAASISAVLLPPDTGVVPQIERSSSDGVVATLRPGNHPGVKPASRAPRTFARGSANKNFVSG